MSEPILWPLMLYILLALTVVVAMLGISYFLGERKKNHKDSEVYESGIEATGSARLRFSPKFYLVAMFFVIFDIEAVFLISWAIAFKEVGWAGYIGATLFIAILSIILIYEWRIGALDIGSSGRKIIKHMKKQNNK